MSELVRLTGLWKNEGKGGSTYLAGGLGAARLIIFANDHKEKPNDPDYIAYVAQPRAKEEGQAQEGEKKTPAPAFNF